MRSSWVASSVLSSNAARAKAAAIELQRHLLTIAPGRRTPFEKSLVVNDTYMANLDDFARATPPLCVWQNNGAWKPLFVFLALRFLLNPDQVLHCESVHARWQWLCAGKRGMKLRTMNAYLRMMQYLDTHHNEFPARAELDQLPEAETRAMNDIYASLEREDVVAPRYRMDFPHLERFNLRAADLNLLVDEDPGPALVHFRAQYEETCHVYLRGTFSAKSFSHFLGIDPRIFVYVLENKTLAGREPRDAQDAQSRPLVLTFFEQVSPQHEDLVVQRVDKTFHGMTANTLTVAELLLHLGYVLPPDPERSAAATEQILEDICFNLQWNHYQAKVVDGAPDIHTYALTEPKDAEDVF